MSAAVESQTIVCPDWCTMPMSEHVRELAAPISGGWCRHESAENSMASVVQMVRADGGEVEALYLYVQTPTLDECWTLEEAKRLRDAVDAAVRVMERVAREPQPLVTS